MRLSVTPRYRDVMPAITVRLSDEDHKLLQLYCVVTSKSQNSVMTGLLQAELDRALPGKREAMRQANPDALWKVLGIPRPEPDAEARQWAGEVIDSLRDSTDRPAA
jgi:hypothetical protein